MVFSTSFCDVDMGDFWKANPDEETEEFLGILYLDVPGS